MKTRILQIALLIISSISLEAQTTMNIYQSNGSVLQIPLSTIDSITYTIGNPGQLATLSTLPVGNISNTSATSGGNITNNGGTAVTQRGVVWGTSPNPTTANNQSSDGSGTGNYTSNLTGLSANTTYYLRAYATNSAGTAYGNELSFTTANGSNLPCQGGLCIGQTYQGGIIAYFLQPGDPGYDPSIPHGIIAAPSDQTNSPGVEWGCSGVSIGGTSQSIGSGYTNTNIIVNNCQTTNIAARICFDLILNGYSDWYLPSSNELLQLKNNLYLNGLGNFTSDVYWSSTENVADASWVVGFLSSYPNNFNIKAYYNIVRAVRSF